MSNIPNNGENEQSLGDGLDRLGNAYRQVQQEEPPELLDQAILSSAHRAVEKNAHWMQFGWLHGLTTAAVFVFALSLIFLQREQVPVPGDALRVDKSVGLQREEPVKKQSREIQGEDLRMEMKEENRKRQDAFQNTPVAEPSQNEAKPPVARGQSLEAEAGTHVSSPVAEVPKAKLYKADEDAAAIEPAISEFHLDEEDIVTDAPEAERSYRQAHPATVAAPAASEAGSSAEDLTDIEQRLQDIIKLKQSGDEEWVTELALFRQTYPDYPLPDELSN